MNVMHHAMKMNPFLFLDLQTVEEQVHQKGLAAADTAPDIETFDPACLRLGTCRKNTQKPTSNRLVVLNALLQVFEPLDDVELGWITDVTFTSEAVLICLANFQSTLLPVFSTLVQPGKITSLELKSPQWLLVLVLTGKGINSDVGSNRTRIHGI